MDGSTNRRTPLLALAFVLAVAGLARADVRGDVDKANTFAEENFDLGDFAAAREQLEGALRKLDRAGLADDPTAVRTRLLLGVAHARLDADDEARAQFQAALSVDAKATLPDRYADERTRALFAEALAAVTAPEPAAIDCAELRGIAHEVIETAEAGTEIAITAHVGPELVGAALTLHYAHGDSETFASAPLAAAAGCDRRGVIPAQEVSAGKLRYFVAAKDANGRLLASNGSAAAPFLVSVRSATSPEQTATETGEGGEAVENEVPDAIDPARPPGPRPRSGCAGCGVGGRDGGAVWLALAAVALAGIGRRRK